MIQTRTCHRGEKNSQAEPKFSERLHRDSAHSHDFGLVLAAPASLILCPLLLFSCCCHLVFVLIFLPLHVSSITWTALSDMEQHIENRCEKEARRGGLMWFDTSSNCEGELGYRLQHSPDGSTEQLTCLADLPFTASQRTTSISASQHASCLGRLSGSGKLAQRGQMSRKQQSRS